MWTRRAAFREYRALIVDSSSGMYRAGFAGIFAVLLSVVARPRFGIMAGGMIQKQLINVVINILVVAQRLFPMVQTFVWTI